MLSIDSNQFSNHWSELYKFWILFICVGNCKSNLLSVIREIQCSKLGQMIIKAFFHGGQKTQGEKNSSPKKLKPFLADKLKVPEDILKIFPQKLQFKLNFLTKCVTKLPQNLKYLQLPPNFGQKVKIYHWYFKKLRQILKRTQRIWLETQCTRGTSLLQPLKKRDKKSL